MKDKFLLFILATISSFFYAQSPYDGKVGINTEQSTEVLDVDGNIRARQLPDKTGDADYSRAVVAKADGTLAYSTGVSRVSINLQSHKANGLHFRTSTAMEGNGGDASKSPNYLIFGNKGEGIKPESSGTFTYKNTQFSAQAGELIRISANTIFAIYRNTSSNSRTPLASISANGDRQVVLTLYLYKGNTLLKKTKQIIAFNGVKDDTSVYDYTYTQYISLDYLATTLRL